MWLSRQQNAALPAELRFQSGKSRLNNRPAFPENITSSCRDQAGGDGAFPPDGYRHSTARRAVIPLWCITCILATN
jgi:hypothetical protein